MNKYVIETKRLCKTYGGRTVVHNLDLHVPQGCVYGFIGPNGAGKSTSMKMLLPAPLLAAANAKVFKLSTS